MNGRTVMICPNCKCYVLNSWKRCEYCGTFLDTGKTTTVSVSDYYKQNHNNQKSQYSHNNSGRNNYGNNNNRNSTYEQDLPSDEYYGYQPSSNTICAILLAIVILILFILVFVII